MTKSLTLLGATILVGSGWVLAAAQQPPAGGAPPGNPQTKAQPGEQEVRAVFAAFLDAYGKADAASIAALFAEDGTLIDSEGVFTRGREAIGEQYADIFAANGGASIPAVAQVESVSFLTPDVARVEGSFKLQPADDLSTPGYEGHFRALGVRRAGKWLIEEIRDDPLPIEVPESHEGYLKELEWMVGDWVDESEGASTTSTVKWAEKNNFLVRTYTMQAAGAPEVSGTQYIGYDPLTASIKSWVFDSEGGHAEGHWTRTGPTEWVIRTSGVLRDGATTAATQVVTQMNKDAAKLGSFDRIVGGEVLPNAPEIIMVRKAPAVAPAP
jgi:uncharacterized protein (TIGR02246 family)